MKKVYLINDEYIEVSDEGIDHQTKVNKFINKLRNETDQLRIDLNRAKKQLRR